MKGNPITIERANTMIARYHGHMDRKTEHVTFSMPELLTWLNSVAPYSDELKIYFGVQADDHDSSPSRLTVILWPYKSGNPAKEPSEGKDGSGGSGFNPYDDGNSGP